MKYIKEYNCEILSPANGEEYVTIPIHKDYVNIMNKAFKEGDKFKKCYSKLYNKVKGKKKKFIFFKPYSEEDLIKYTEKSISKYYPKLNNLKTEDYIMFTSFVKSINVDLYNSLFKGLETMVLGANSIDKSINVQTVQYLHLVTNISLHAEFYAEFINLKKLSEEQNINRKFDPSNPLDVYLYELFKTDSFEVFKIASFKSLENIKMLIDKISNNDTKLFNKDDILDIKAYLSIYAKKIKVNGYYPYIATNIILDEINGFNTAFRSIVKDNYLSDDQMLEIEDYMNIKFESISKPNHLGVIYAKYKYSNLTNRKKEALNELLSVMKKAAMFGLDARIALAIFGALSVISGAALYSAIQTSKATAMLADMNELAKAFEQYYLDTGEATPKLDEINHSSAVLANGAITPKAGWNGPYLAYPTQREGTATYDLFLDYSSKYPSSRMNISRLKSGDWPAGIDGDTVLTHTGTGAKCASGNCAFYAAVRSTAIPYSLLSAIDVIVDGEDDNEKGKFKYLTWSGNGSMSYLKIMPTSDIADGTKVY